MMLDFFSILQFSRQFVSSSIIMETMSGCNWNVKFFSNDNNGKKDCIEKEKEKEKI